MLTHKIETFNLIAFNCFSNQMSWVRTNKKEFIWKKYAHWLIFSCQLFRLKGVLSKKTCYKQQQQQIFKIQSCVTTKKLCDALKNRTYSFCNVHSFSVVFIGKKVLYNMGAGRTGSIVRYNCFSSTHYSEWKNCLTTQSDTHRQKKLFFPFLKQKKKIHDGLESSTEGNYVY